MMGHHDNYKELCVDLQLDNDSLREKLRVLGGNYDHLRRELYSKPQPHVPGEVDDGVYECGKCCASLDDEWSYCPCCGSEIDWDGEDDGDWYVEEGERFLQAEVYDPIREAMRS